MSPTVQGLALALTVLGDSGYMFAGSVLVAVMAWWGCRSTDDSQVRADMSRLFERALLFFAATAASGLAVQGLKHLVGRARPRVNELSAFSFHPISWSNAFASFPSGHAASAFAAVTVLGLTISRGRPLLGALAVAIGASRVVLREHYPSDVVAGAALGTTVALCLAKISLPSTSIRRLGVWLVEAPGPSNGTSGRSGRDWSVSFGYFCSQHRRWFPPALVAGLFAIAVPPADLFGSEVAEHVKDGCAILIALAGLTVRALVVGCGQAPEPSRDRSVAIRRLNTEGMYSLCRHPLYAGNIMIITGIFLMHGNRWIVLFGTLAYVLIHLAMVTREEAELRRAFGARYEDYSRRVPRWFAKSTRLANGTGGLRFDMHHMLKSEYPVIGMTVIALATAEFYEEIEEPLVGGQILYLAFLASVILGITVVIGTVWLAGQSRLRSP